MIRDSPKLFSKPPPASASEEEAPAAQASAGTKRKADEADLDGKDSKDDKKLKQEGDAFVIEDSDDEEQPVKNGSAVGVIELDD